MPSSTAVIEVGFLGVRPVQPHPLEGGKTCGVGLPSLESADPELSIGRVEAATHGRGAELDGDSEDAALHLSVDFFFHDPIDRTLTIRQVQQFSGPRPFG